MTLPPNPRTVKSRCSAGTRDTPQCGKLATCVENDRPYCAQHAPSATLARRKARDARYERAGKVRSHDYAVDAARRKVADAALAWRRAGAGQCGAEWTTFLAAVESLDELERETP